MRSILARLAVAMTAAACGGHARPAHPTPIEENLAAELDAVAYRGAGSGSVAGVSLSRLANGAVRAWRVSAGERGQVAAAGESMVVGGRPVSDSHPAPASDLRIEAAVRGAISTDPLLAGLDLDVDVDAGVVRLSGDLATAEQAARVLSIALDTPGVVAAESRCAWLSRSH